jgi:hypothetical protein
MDIHLDTDLAIAIVFIWGLVRLMLAYYGRK